MAKKNKVKDMEVNKKGLVLFLLASSLVLLPILVLIKQDLDTRADEQKLINLARNTIICQELLKINSNYYTYYNEDIINISGLYVDLFAINQVCTNENEGFKNRNITIY